MKIESFRKEKSVLPTYEMQANLEKYEKTCEKRRLAGLKSAEKRKQRKQMLTCEGNNIIKNNNNKSSAYDFDEIERLELVARMKN